MATDDALNCLIQVMLVLFFLLGIILRLCDDEGGDAIFSLLDAKEKDSCSILVGIKSDLAAPILMFVAGLTVVLVPIGMLLSHLLFHVTRSVSVLHDASTSEPPVLILRQGERYHLFLYARALPTAPRLHPYPNHLDLWLSLAGATSGALDKISAPSSSGSCSCCCRASCA